MYQILRRLLSRASRARSRAEVPLDEKPAEPLCVMARPLPHFRDAGVVGGGCGGALVGVVALGVIKASIAAAAGESAGSESKVKER